MIPNAQNDAKGAGLYTASTFPTKGGVYYAFHPYNTRGTQSEGSGGSLATTTIPDAVALIPGAFPVTPTSNVLAEWTGTRWVMDQFGLNTGSSGHIPGCPCDPVPSPLTMTVTNPALNYYIFQSCIIQYYPTIPPALSGVTYSGGMSAIGNSGYFSTSSFTDGYSLAPFYYWLQCFQGVYALTRIYPKTYALTWTGTDWEYTLTGGWQIDGSRYSWLVGGSNTCKPFALASGAIFSGGNASTVVTITG